MTVQTLAEQTPSNAAPLANGVTGAHRTLGAAQAHVTLENGLKTFWGYPMSRCYPILYPNGSWPTGGAFNGTATLASINANRKAISLSGLPAGFVLSVGDYVSIAGDLHQVMEPATANGSGVTGEFEVRPHLWPAAAVADPVSVKQPACLMAIVPGSLSSDAQMAGWGSVSFSAMEARL